MAVKLRRSPHSGWKFATSVCRRDLPLSIPQKEFPLSPARRALRHEKTAELLDDRTIEIEFACRNGDEAILKAKRDTSSAACYKARAGLWSLHVSAVEWRER
jgi:hypothetical protein